jgi:prepilin-type N-terminal cleavage/methylation domain-containing protein/prepilin-type processing-associated H-X9-DG protein
MRPKVRGFTLVELLVVIGIIALLISVLLPALQGARKSAQTIKCAAAMRDIGNAVQMYTQENKGYMPPLRTNGSAYTLGDDTLAAGQCYWFNFLAKYLTKTKVGRAATADRDSVEARRNIFWSCPAWNGYITTLAGAGGLVREQPGIGWNAFPEFTASFPEDGAELGEGGTYGAYVGAPSSPDKWATFINRWYKQVHYTRPSERALISDTSFYVLEARPPYPDGTIPGQGTVRNALWVGPDGAHQTTFDFYRHGKYPDPKDGSQFKPNGGKVAYNVLFCDGHVTTLVDRAEGYRVIRMKFPG